MQNCRNLLVTGATGFIGMALVRTLKSSQRFDVEIAMRSSEKKLNVTSHVVGEINGSTKWSDALFEKHLVLHSAAIATTAKRSCRDASTDYFRVNVEGTVNLAGQAILAGVKRFVFISSVKVMGENSRPGKRFRWDDLPSPTSAYGASKWQAEQELLSLCEGTEMELVIIRSPLVYGPNVKGNFRTILTCLDLGIPLPLRGVMNKRSFIGIDNLVDIISNCLSNPLAANRIFLVSDDNDLSTTALLEKLALAGNKKLRLFSIPSALFKICEKAGIAQNLFGSLEVDIRYTKEILNWTPPVSVEEGLRRCFDDT